jgi:hypothetical protein
MATRRPAAPAPTVRVKPSPKLGPTEYVPGIPAAGIDLPLEEAAPMLEAGIVVKVRVRPAKPASSKE